MDDHFLVGRFKFNVGSMGKLFERASYPSRLHLIRHLSITLKKTKSEVVMKYIPRGLNCLSMNVWIYNDVMGLSCTWNKINMHYVVREVPM
jgi:hypothetical protein